MHADIVVDITGANVDSFTVIGEGCVVLELLGVPLVIELVFVGVVTACVALVLIVKWKVDPKPS